MSIEKSVREVAVNGVKQGMKLALGMAEDLAALSPGISGEKLIYLMTLALEQPETYKRLEEWERYGK